MRGAVVNFNSEMRILAFKQYFGRATSHKKNVVTARL